MVVHKTNAFGGNMACGTWVSAQFLVMPWFMVLLVILLYGISKTWSPCEIAYLC